MLADIWSKSHFSAHTRGQQVFTEMFFIFILQSAVKANALTRMKMIFTQDIFTEQVRKKLLNIILEQLCLTYGYHSH